MTTATTVTEHTTSSSREKSFLLPYSSEPKWKSTKYGFVPDAKGELHYSVTNSCQIFTKVSKQGLEPMQH